MLKKRKLNTWKQKKETSAVTKTSAKTKTKTSVKTFVKASAKTSANRKMKTLVAAIVSQEMDKIIKKSKKRREGKGCLSMYF